MSDSACSRGTTKRDPIEIRCQHSLTFRSFGVSSNSHEDLFGSRSGRIAHRQDGITIRRKHLCAKTGSWRGLFLCSVECNTLRWISTVTNTYGDANNTSDLRLTGGQIVLRALRDNGVKHIFGYPGAAVLPIYDELFQQDEIMHILVRHEQAAGHAAEGYARSSGKVGVMLVTSGPGVTNAITALQNALMDSTPLLCLSGQVPTMLIGTDAFQECDTVGITRSCTKHNWLVRDTDKLADTIHRAFWIAKSGRPGPVLVDMPKDVLFATGIYRRPLTSQG